MVHVSRHFPEWTVTTYLQQVDLSQVYLVEEDKDKENSENIGISDHFHLEIG